MHESSSGPIASECCNSWYQSEAFLREKKWEKKYARVDATKYRQGSTGNMREFRQSDIKTDQCGIDHHLFINMDSAVNRAGLLCDWKVQSSILCSDILNG